jgi:hypothetical protein
MVQDALNVDLRSLVLPGLHIPVSLARCSPAAQLKTTRSKIYARQNCSYSLPALRTMIPKRLGPAVVTDEIFWKFFQRVERILEAYRSGETYGTEAFKNRVCKATEGWPKQLMNFLTFNSAVNNFSSV